MINTTQDAPNAKKQSNALNSKQQEMWQHDLNLKGDDYDYLIGCDEAGRGALASCIVGAAVILSSEAVNIKINDSKKLSPKSREKLYDQIIDNCVAYHIEMLDANYIDTYGIQLANKNVLYRSGSNVISKFGNKNVLTIVDGNSLWEDENLLWINQADGKSLSVAAASILAKVFRDRIMIGLSDQYPEYLFGQHKGYGTKIHKDLIRQYGKIENIHRNSFTRDLPNRSFAC